MKASSGINAIEPKSDDTMDIFYQDTIQGGHGQPELVRKLVQESPSALAWLTDAGVDLSVVSQCGGHSRARTHRCPPGPNGMPVPVGFKLVDTLKKRAQQLGIDMQTNARVTSLHLRNNTDTSSSPPPTWTLTINGDTEVNVDALVLTSGGFGGQIHATEKDEVPTLLKEHAPQWVDRATTNGPWANGDGVRLGLALGASTVDMDKVQIHPTGFVDPANPDAMAKFLAPEALRAYGGVLVNAQGQRFVNELTTRDKLTQAILTVDGGGTQKPVYLVLSDQAAKDFGESTLGFYAKKGLVQQIQGNDSDLLMQTLARAMGLDDTATLTTTFKEYDGYTDGQQDAFGKSRFPSQLLTSPCYWLAQITPCVHYTMGGLKINTDAQILSKENDTPIPGKKKKRVTYVKMLKLIQIGDANVFFFIRAFWCR